MIDKKLQMMDAGMVLFETEKPFGTVIGGIKTEMIKYGKVLRRNEFDENELPESAEDCDLILDWSSMLRRRCISCRLEDAGITGKTEDGEDIHRYASIFKEGNRNTPARKVLAWALALACIVLGCIGIPYSPKALTVIVGIVAAGFALYHLLKPSTKAQEVVSDLLEIIKEAK